MQGKDTKIARQKRRWNAKSRPIGRLSPYLDTIRGIYRRSVSVNRGFLSLLRIANSQFSAKTPTKIPKPLETKGEMWYNKYGKYNAAHFWHQGGGLFA